MSHYPNKKTDLTQHERKNSFVTKYTCFRGSTKRKKKEQFHMNLI